MQSSTLWLKDAHQQNMRRTSQFSLESTMSFALFAETESKIKIKHLKKLEVRTLLSLQKNMELKHKITAKERERSSVGILLFGMD